jgi:hypothetical protein
MRGDERTQDGIGDLTSVPGGPSAGTRNSGFTRGPLNRVPLNDAVIDAAAERWGKRAVPLHPVLAGNLDAWRKATRYGGQG